MKTTVLSWETAYENATFSDWMQENEIEDVLGIFEGDPDLIKIDSNKLLFVDIETNGERFVIYLDSEYQADEEKVKERLLLFFQDNFKDFYESPEYNTWPTFDNNSDIIAYRGGKGYYYTLWMYKQLKK